MNGSNEAARREALIIPDSDLQTAAVLQLISRHTSEYKLLIPLRILTVADDRCLVAIFPSSIHGYHTTVGQTVNFSLWLPLPATATLLIILLINDRGRPNQGLTSIQQNQRQGHWG